jgi:hypothetical protein
MAPVCSVDVVLKSAIFIKDVEFMGVLGVGVGRCTCEWRSRECVLASANP